MSTKAQPKLGEEAGGEVVFTKYDRRSLTYANSFDSSATATIIRAMEWITVTSDPRRRCACAISMPIGPPPMTTR